MGLSAIGRILGAHHKTVSRWLVKAAGQLPVNQSKPRACSFIEVYELYSFITKRIKLRNLYSAEFYYWQSALLFSVVLDWSRLPKIFSSIKGLPTRSYGRNFLKTYDNLVPTALHFHGKTFTTEIESLNCRLKHYPASFIVERFPTANQKRCWKFPRNCPSIRYIPFNSNSPRQSWTI